MSNKNQDLVLHLKLDTIIPDGAHRKVRNALSKSPLTESQYTVRGNPQVVPDEHFGSCFSFDGNDDVIELTPTSIPTGNEITVSFWANGGNNLPNENFIVLAQTANNSRVLNIHLPWTDKIIYFDCGGNSTDRDVDFDRISRSTDTDNSQDAVAYKGKWNHWAFTKDAAKGEMKIYFNGCLWHHEENKKQPILAAAKACIAKNYPGKIANFRIYQKALLPQEIEMDMKDDRSTIAAFNLAYPLDFDLYEGDDKESVIFIENDTKGEEFVFEICNHTEQAITLPAKSGGVSPDNHHFELRFRPDTLSSKSLQQLALVLPENWSMSSPVTQTDGIVSLYFLMTNTTALEANGTITLTLQNISASAEGGARTTRVEFLCPAFTYQGETLTHYYREKTLSIISHRGKKNIPLHVSFVESNRILNDGETPNELILRIVNVLKDKSIPLIPASKGDEASKFIISFDVDFDWGLGTKSQVEGIEIQGKDWRRTLRYVEEWKIVKKTQDQSPTWTITNQNEGKVELGSEKGLELTISNIISSLPSGQTNLYIRYENIPGYWDGTFVCTIEKTPILYKEGNVGIGISDPPQKLTVGEGHIQIDPGYVFGNNPNDKFEYDNKNIGHYSLGWFKDSWNQWGSTGWLSAYSGLKIFTSGKQVFSINQGGNVAIGIADPGSYKLNLEGGNTRLGGALTVNGNLDITGTLTIGQTTIGEDELRITQVFNGAINDGETKTHTIYSLASHTSSYLELIVLMHDINSNTYRLNYKAEFAWYREWDQPPKKDLLLQSYSKNWGNIYSVDSNASGNDIQVVLRQSGYRTNSVYKVIAKYMLGR